MTVFVVKCRRCVYHEWDQDIIGAHRTREGAVARIEGCRPLLSQYVREWGEPAVTSHPDGELSADYPNGCYVTYEIEEVALSN